MRLCLCAVVVFLSPACVLGQILAPTAVEAIAFGPRDVRVFWSPAQGAVKYAIYRDGARIGVVDGSETQYLDSTARPGITYTYNVAAVDSSGKEAPGRPYVEQSDVPLLQESPCEVLIVGATTAGVAAAVTAARYGLRVILIEETRRLGGMPVNGLGATDIRRPERSSGFFEEFRRKVSEIYGQGDGLTYEPRVAHQAIKGIIWFTPGLIVHRGVRPIRIGMRGNRIQKVIAEEVKSGRRVTFLPKIVVDATECGDVAAWAGAPFRVGRESRSKREPHAGHIFYDRAGDRPLPGSTGRGDKRVQAYAYLMTVKDYGPGADRTIPRPPGYDKSKYAHATPWDKSWAVTSGKLPNGKFEVNQHPEGSDLQGVNSRYPTASYGERRRIEELYRNHALGYLYYVQTEEGHRSISLSEDDYRDSDGWPQLLYIREARRFESDVVLDETDISRARESVRPDSIGLGDYPMDSHALQPKTDWTSPDMGEGEFYLPQYTPWHQVPYSVMIPKGVDNVFAPTAVSATHVAFGTLRLEPVRMHFGQAAGIAAYLCLRHGVIPREAPVRQIQAELVKHDVATAERPAKDGIGAPGPSANPAYLYFFPDVPAGTLKFRSIQWLAARGFYPTPRPRERAGTSGQAAAPFEPDSPIQAVEASRLLNWLDRRRSGGPARDQPWHRFGVSAESTVNRGMAAELISAFMGWTAPVGPGHYADLTRGTASHDAAESLYSNWIDSRLWGIFEAYGPDGKLYFRPEQPITRAQFAELIYLAHIHIGPLWEDQPMDRNPIAVP